MPTPKTYYHGTTPEALEGIRRKGFQTCHTWDGKCGWWQTSGGNLGHGIYLTEDWHIALWYAPVLLRVSLSPGTRVIDVTTPYDRKVIGYLKREFGREILKRDPLKAMPGNKRLTEREAVTLLKYHYNKVEKLIWTKDWFNLNSKRYDRNYKHIELMFCLRKILDRCGIHGFGEPDEENGLVVFDGNRVRLEETVVSIPGALWRKAQLQQPETGAVSNWIKDTELDVPSVESLKRCVADFDRRQSVRQIGMPPH